MLGRIRAAWGVGISVIALRLTAGFRTTTVGSRLSGQRNLFLLRLETPHKHNDDDCSLLGFPQGKLLIHWRGEGVEGYSLQFRHVEFWGALEAAMDMDAYSTATGSARRLSKQPEFVNALNYTGTELSSELKISGYNQAMQYLSVPDEVTTEIYIEAARRCSLIHAMYLVVAESRSEDGYDAISEEALRNGDFDDMRPDGPHSDYTWCVRVRNYGANNNTAKERRYGARARSITLERQALQSLTPLLLSFGGKVNLKKPDCKIYLFDGLFRRNVCVNVLARRIASGARTTIINPNTRLCVTNTPLCPVAAFIMCNTAQVRPESTLLDPFCGSAAILLAASMLSRTCRTVGIEIAHNGIVSRDDIRRDFTTRGLTEPMALIHGDSSDYQVRTSARLAIGNVPFDCIVTDPPYGIRESTGVLERRPIDELLQMVANDRTVGTPLLRSGGRLVVFLPHQIETETAADILPTSDQLSEAGLRFEFMREQPLNDLLSRWLVSFICV